ncbi:uracil-DNA glycosylase-like protein [Endogone sp. FLAS-F59071]|nr:uracil-DNA glycosylase-like protein [Endogone sp. FLAS-F59071]|eukprot:RUS16593.1 uracil-DNA glycosylase-like protein [Endogone sp. FLAS-F59071]
MSNDNNNSTQLTPDAPLVTGKKRKRNAAMSAPSRTKIKVNTTKTVSNLKGQQGIITAQVKTDDGAAVSEEIEQLVSNSEGALSLTRAATVEELFHGLDEETKALLKLESETLEEEWLKALSPELRKSYFVELKRFLMKEKANGENIFPPENQIYSWSNFTPLSTVKVVILGQGIFFPISAPLPCPSSTLFPSISPLAFCKTDPYHDNGQAHGLCFSVPIGVRPPPSLVNIYEGLSRDIAEFRKPSHGYLENWAKEGVLMLNASLTVRAHAAGSHAGKGWESFTDAIVNYLNEKSSGLVFMLWGSHAQKKGAKINKKKHLILKAVHPSPLSAYKGFMDCKHWSQANEYLKEKGKTPVNWNCLV